MQKKIGVFYGSETGHTASRALDLLNLLEGSYAGAGGVEIKDRAMDLGLVAASVLLGYDVIFLGVPTWNIGELQADVQDHFEALAGMDLSGRAVALFGLGDQEGYPSTYQDALGIMGERVRECGGKLIGFTSVAGHHFTGSRGVEGDQFMGLALDEENQEELSMGRIREWVDQLKPLVFE